MCLTHSLLLLQVGADINLMAMVPWRAHMLQFVCGLGPRKAQHLLKTIQRQGGYLDARRKLLAGRGARGCRAPGHLDAGCTLLNISTCHHHT